MSTGLPDSSDNLSRVCPATTDQYKWLCLSNVPNLDNFDPPAPLQEFVQLSQLELVVSA